MNLRKLFGLEPAIRPESAKELKNRVVETVDFSEWITRMKSQSPNATIRVKRVQKLSGEAGGGYLGEPILISRIQASTFDRLLDEAFGGGGYTLEYWEGDHRFMMKNSKPPVAVTHIIDVAGLPKRLPGRKGAVAESTAQPKTLMGLMIKQFDTAEGIAAVTAFTTVAISALKGVMSGTNQSGGVKETVETIGAIFKMLPSAPDEIDVLERYQKLSSMFAASARPPVNIGAGSNTFWESLTKVASQVAGTLIANAQSNGGAKPGMLQSAVNQSQSPVNQGQSPEAVAETMSGSPAADTTPQQQFVNAKIASVQAAMAAKMDPLSIANDLWSLLAFVIENGMVQDSFVQSLYADPNRAFDQIIRTYAPESPSYPKLGELKRIVVEYIIEDAQLQESQAYADQMRQKPESETGEPGDGQTIRVVEFPQREPEEGSEDIDSESVRTEPVVIGEPVGGTETEYHSDQLHEEAADVTAED